MATQNINSSSPGSNLAASPAPGKPLATAKEGPDAAVRAMQNTQEGGDKVRLSAEAVNRAALNQQGQQTQIPAPNAAGEHSPSRGATAQQPATTAPANQENGPAPSPAETQRESTAAQAEQRIEDAQTIKNYTNASLYTQINGRQIDEKV